MSPNRVTIPASVPAIQRGDALDVSQLPSYGFAHRSLPVAAFAITGYSSVLMWRNSVNHNITAIRDNANLLYHRNVLLPEFSQRYRAHYKDCAASVPQAEATAPFSFVAAIGADGHVLRLWSDRSTNVYQCVRGRLLFDRFPPPPTAPFYLYIHMRFAN